MGIRPSDEVDWVGRDLAERHNGGRDGGEGSKELWTMQRMTADRKGPSWKFILYKQTHGTDVMAEQSW